MNKNHFLLVCFSFHSHINPTLQLATKLIDAGARVTVATTVHGLDNLKSRLLVPELVCVSFSDGHDGTSHIGKPNYFKEIKIVGSSSLKNILLTKANEGQKVDFLIYGLSLPWVADVARELHVPSALFFFQSATSFSLVYHFMKKDGYRVVNSNIDPTSTIKIPGLPLLRYNDIPEYLKPNTKLEYSIKLAPVFQEHIKHLEENPNSMVLINTFGGLEEESIKSLPNSVNIFSMGPLLPAKTEDLGRETYLQWLDSKPKKSVIYVSYGSILEFHKKQKEEMFQGLVQSGHPFLWVIRNHGENDEVVKNYNTEYDGMIVKWCLQMEVLNHASIGCFVSHCGWNSTMESVVSGVPLVGCPQMVDQMMNAKMVEEVWGNGVKAVADDEDTIGREEIKRCVKVVMGSEEIKKKSEKLKKMAMEAMVDGGSSHRNLRQLFKCLN